MLSIQDKRSQPAPPRRRARTGAGFRTAVLLGMLAALWLALVAGPVGAQDPAAPAAGRVVSSGRSYLIETALVVLLSAGALFAVGRTSRRG